MAVAIPDFARVSAQLHDLLQKSYKKAGKRKKSAIKAIKLIELGWGSEHEEAFEKIKSLLCDSIKLAFPKPDHAICIHTDASK